MRRTPFVPGSKAYSITISRDADKAWTLEQLAEIADHWQKLLGAADAGDERAKDFLGACGFWASAELAKSPKS